MVLQAIKYQRGSLEILDQLQLPHRVTYDVIQNSEDAWEAIYAMRVRGAPAIAIVAALGLAVELTKDEVINLDNEHVAKLVHEKLDYLITSRPTAVNLAAAATALKKVVRATVKQGDGSVREAFIKAAEQMLEDDVADNEAIGKNGAEWILSNAPAAKNGPVSMLTHCNTGSLATAGYGTALGVIRSLHAMGSLKMAFCTETRPYNQGSRLTSFELLHDGIPATLITDSMASALLRLNGESESIAGIVVGADRVAANGDTANKIGTYALAIAAKYHGIKFLVAAPRTTIDMATSTGTAIKIEERPGRELTTIRGLKVVNGNIDVDGATETVSIAANGIGVWNPAFDVTPCELIGGIITEVGVMEKDGHGRFHLDEIMDPSSRQTNGMTNEESKSGTFPDKPF